MNFLSPEKLNSIPETELVNTLTEIANLTKKERDAICERAAHYVRRIREDGNTGLMESFLAEYGLSTDEGIALMCLAEALLRVPDAETIDALIEDKIAPSDWGAHLGKSSSSLVNASTWALLFTGRVLDDDQKGLVKTLRGAVKRMGEPVIRRAVAQAMKEMGRQFVLGQTIQDAMERASKMEKHGYTYSYDMLGEAAKTETDAKRYHLAYSRAISAIAQNATHSDIRKNPGISVKLSALHPRYEWMQRERVMEELVPRLRSLALLAKSANMGFNVDAEEANRLSISLDVIETVLSEPALKGWDGFGVVVQAYGKRASGVLDFLYDLSKRLNRKIMVRLVKGAYWDSEIKRAQVWGLDSFPVFTQKSATDISYIANARKLLSMTDHIYPQFATHNAHTISAILDMCHDPSLYEFQRLHGMGEALHALVKEENQTNCRIYAPVGAHRDLLAYLVRRLLENGANSSFVNQIVDEKIPAEEVVSDPFEEYDAHQKFIKTGTELFLPERKNSKGYDIQDPIILDEINHDRAQFLNKMWEARPLIAGSSNPEKAQDIRNPADESDLVGHVFHASEDDVKTAFETHAIWEEPLQNRQTILNAAADLMEKHHAEIFAILQREAGKTLIDATNELREAVDFLRYYASQADETPAKGLVTCISPWNFPLAIFTGQISAALAQGNAVLAKPAEQTPLIAYFAVQLLHEAGVPKAALQFLPGLGADVGAKLTAHSEVKAVTFTGSTQTAKIIRSTMAKNLDAGSVFIAETGGLNAMIVDSTALPEQAVTAIVESAFQSAGQRCSALRCLYIQDDIADHFLEMLIGATKEMTIGNPWHNDTDCGPVIDHAAREGILNHIEIAQKENRVLYQGTAPKSGIFVAPTMISLNSITELEREVFGPVLHVVGFKANEIPKIIADINQTGYGLTFGLQTRIDDRVQDIIDHVHAGNIYVNRNQIGAIVGSQPFGGEGLSGTGPKAGGPYYLNRFKETQTMRHDESWSEGADMEALNSKLNSHPPTQKLSTTTLPGPTGESNRLSLIARKPILCLGPGLGALKAQGDEIRAQGGFAVEVEGLLDAEALVSLNGFSGVIWWGDNTQAKAYEQALAKRDGEIIPLIVTKPDMAHIFHERTVCVDTTASGGNAELLSEQSDV